MNLNFDSPFTLPPPINLVPHVPFGKFIHFLRNAKRDSLMRKSYEIDQKSVIYCFIFLNGTKRHVIFNFLILFFFLAPREGHKNHFSLKTSKVNPPIKKYLQFSKKFLEIYFTGY